MIKRKTLSLFLTIFLMNKNAIIILQIPNAKKQLIADQVNSDSNHNPTIKQTQTKSNKCFLGI